MAETYLIGGLRTPIGKKNGCLKSFLPEKLAAAVLNGILAKYSLTSESIDAVVAGNVVGPGGNIARVCVLEAGWPYSVPAFTVDAQCGSGLTSIDMGAAMIESGRAQLVIAGGVESNSLAPSRRLHANDPRYKGPDFYYEQAPFSPEWVGNPDIGSAAEMMAADFAVSRSAMDEFALNSHKKASAAQKDGSLSDIILPLNSEGKCIDKDEGPKQNMNLKLLARLKSAFVKNGSITAGNSCLKHDGAAFVLLASAEAAAKYGLTVQAVVSPAVTLGCDPNIFPLGPVYAMRKMLQMQKLSLQDDIDAVEINEAFAVQMIACCRQLDLSFKKLNSLGGAIAFGHPYGASGAIILLHLLQALKKRRGKVGIASIGAVGGLSTAILLQRINVNAYN